ncbi:hypothetical protein T4D_16318 [Trichinella pseudospiralis]|uniref:Uncharacterized protein n=1 Tax=Trichinella pseudospiralis TaxID=6337 RepID=A0A0V1FWM3_TRIPS|nr:hypothetical protein T4D_16318 [Trichinella pseudospiralis]
MLINQSRNDDVCWILDKHVKSLDICVYMEDNVPDGILSQESHLSLNFSYPWKFINYNMEARFWYHKAEEHYLNNIANAVSEWTAHTFMIAHMAVWAKTLILPRVTALQACYHAYIPTQAFDSHKAFCPAGYGERNWQKRIKDFNEAEQIDGLFKEECENGDIYWYYNSIQ